MEKVGQERPDLVNKRLIREWFGHSTAAQVLTAFRYFRLVGPGGVPTGRLRRLAEASQEDKSRIFREMLEEGYSDVLSDLQIGLGRISVDEAFRRYHYSAPTQARAIRLFDYFLAMAKYPLPATPTAVTALEVGMEGPVALAKPVSQRTVELNSGGKLTVTLSADAFSLSSDDRAFVNRLLDLLEEYERERRSGAPEGSRDPDDLPFE